MPGGITDPRVVGYSRTLYASGFRYRSLAGFVGLLVGLTMSIVVISVFSVLGPNIRFLVPTMVIVCGGVLIAHVAWMVGGRQRAFSIETAGIVNAGRFVPWSEVRRLAAEGEPGGTNLTLFYETVSCPMVRHHLYSSQRFLAAQYEQLIHRLREEGLVESFPGLELGGYQAS